MEWELLHIIDFSYKAVNDSYINMTSLNNVEKVL